MTALKTERLILRPWCEQDLEPFARLNADPKVMEYFPATLSKAESDQLAQRIKTKMDEKGWGMWAVSVPGIAEFIGFIGLNSEDQASFPAPFTPAVEVGWRIAFEHWGKGYATEGAKAALAYGFETLNLGEIVSFTAVQNMRSRRVMERIGMHHNPKDDFEHPKLQAGHPLRKHVLYRLSQGEWQTHKHQKQKYVYELYSKSIGFVELVNESNLKEVFSFLENNENFSLFLLGNLEAHGHKLTAASNSGNFKLIRCEGKVVAVFSLIRRGNLVV